MLVIGIDDAGRGPIIGPMILAGVLLSDEQDKKMKDMGATDSKLIPHQTRIRLAKEIKNNSIKYKIVISSPTEIDSFVESKRNLNTLEAIKAAEIINSLNDGNDRIRVIIDCPSVNTESWKQTLIKHIINSNNLEISCEHKADLNHQSASAASILAKVAREEEVAKIKEKYGEIGSGYPSDPITKRFLELRGKELEDSGIFRKSWQTWKNLFIDKEQSTLF